MLGIWNCVGRAGNYNAQEQLQPLFASVKGVLKNPNKMLLKIMC